MVTATIQKNINLLNFCCSGHGFLLVKALVGALHWQTEHHMHPKTKQKNKKTTTFSNLHHQNGSKFYHFLFMSEYTWYLSYSKIWYPNLMIF